MLPGAQSQALRRFQPKQHSEQSSSYSLPRAVLASAYKVHVRGVTSVVRVLESGGAKYNNKIGLAFTIGYVCIFFVNEKSINERSSKR